jgi:hypothetical protein
VLGSPMSGFVSGSDLALAGGSGGCILSAGSGESLDSCRTSHIRR